MAHPPDIRPYTVAPDATPLPALLARVNDVLYQNYSADYTAGPGPGKVVAMPMSYYDRLLRRLRRIPGVEFLTMEDLIAGRGSRDGIRVTIRHDVDADVVAAQEMARLERAHGIPTTYYFLHTAFYYGHFDADGVFHRYEAMADLYRAVQDLGHEVSLHIDPLLIYQDHKIDGAQALVEELNWLRARGLRVPGAAAHNHTSVYGAQNYEIFKGKLRNHLLPGGDRGEVIDVPEVVHNGKWAPLHVLDMQELGLAYEAHDTYGVDGYAGIMSEINYACINQTWSIQARPYDRGLRQGPGGWARLDDALSKVRPGEAIVFTTHPLYYGGRHRRDDGLTPALTSRHVAPSPHLGWHTFRPSSLVASVTHDAAGAVDEQVIAIAAANGLLDRPALPGVTPVLLLGGAGTAPSDIAVPEHLSVRLEQRLQRLGGEPVQVRAMAFEGMGAARLAAWFDRAEAGLVTGVVLLAVSPDAPALNLPGRWPEPHDDAGPAPRAYGDALVWDPKARDVVVQRFTPDTPTPPRDPATPPRLHDLDPAARHDGVPVLDALAAIYRRLAAMVRARGGTPAMLVEATDPERPEAFHQAASRLAEAAGMPLLNPFPELLAWTGPGRMVTEAGRLTADGHLEAAALLAPAVQGLLAAARERPAPATLASARPAAARAERSPSGQPITIVNLFSISYTGTTWINTVLGSHPRAFALGPPDRFLDLWKTAPEKLCLLRGAESPFWPAFCKRYDPRENFFVQLAEFSGKDIIVINNPVPTRMGLQLADHRLRLRSVRVVRDGRAVTASFARKFSKPFGESLRDWFAPALATFPWTIDDADTAHLRYEDMIEAPLGELRRLGRFIGLTYDASSLRYWEHTHHPISGNQGMFAMMRFYQGLPVPKFESREYYEELVRRGVETSGMPIRDERWREQVTEQDLYTFDRRSGADNARVGYPRDHTPPELAAAFAPAYDDLFGAAAAPAAQAAPREEAGLDHTATADASRPSALRRIARRARAMLFGPRR